MPSFHRQTSRGVIQVTKGRATSGTTTVARGGFAAAMGKGDSPELHLKEIIEHGGELIDPDLARTWTRDSGGEVTDGNANQVTEVTDIWTFARNTRARDPNWTLVETRSPN